MGEEFGIGASIVCFFRQSACMFVFWCYIVLKLEVMMAVTKSILLPTGSLSHKCNDGNDGKQIDSGGGK